MEHESLEEMKRILELTEDNSTLVREIAILREENIDLKKRVKYNAKYKALSHKMFRLISYIKGSRSEKLSASAKELCDEFEEVKQSRMEIFA